MKSREDDSKTRWHILLGSMLEDILTPVGIRVITDFPVMSEPPECDILLLRKERKAWSEEQRNRLSDGIRDCGASHILIEFKYTESVNENALLQALGYDYFYRRTQQLAGHDVGTFLVSSKTPEKETLRIFGYEQSDKPGVYHSRNRLLRRVSLILLNELSDEPHNAFVKCFASRKKEKASAFDILRRRDMIAAFGRRFEWFIEGFMQLCLRMGEEIMKIKLTPEMVGDVGKEWREFVLSHSTPEERLMGLRPEERLMGLRPEERLMGLRPEERLMGLRPEERLMGLRPEERLMGLKPEEIIAKYGKEKILSGMTERDIEAYLKKLKKSKRSKKSDSQ